MSRWSNLIPKSITSHVHVTDHACNRKYLPPQLVLKKTTEKPNKLSYLHICIQIQGRKFVVLYTIKGMHLNFIIIVNFPYLDSTIPTKPAYGIYISQLVRIVRICDRYADFIERHCILTTRLFKQGYKYDHICSYFKRFSGKYKDIFNKFKITHIKDGIPLPLNTVGRLNTCRMITVRGGIELEQDMMSGLLDF